MARPLTLKQKDEIEAMILEGRSRRDTAARAGVSTATVQRIANGMDGGAPPPAPRPPPKPLELTSPPVASDSDPLGALSTDEQRAFLGRSIRGAVADAETLRSEGNTAQAATATRLIGQLSSALLQVEKLAAHGDEVARPMPDDEALDEDARAAVSALWTYVERAAVGK